MKKFLFLSATILFFISSAFCDYNSLSVPDSAEIRREIKEKWLSANIDLIRQNETELKLNSVGEEFQIRLEETEDTFAVIIAPLQMLDMMVFTEKGIEKKTVPMYPSDAKGSWVLVRSSKTGKPLFIRMYFAADSDVYVQFSPDRNKTVADFVISNLYASRSSPLGFSFEYLYTASLQDIVVSTEKNLPWNYAKIISEDYNVSLSMASLIRKNLSRIEYSPDSAYDESFKPVRISDGKKREETAKEGNISLSETGFTKWIVDGLIEPITGGGSYMAPLTQRTVEYKPQGYKGIHYDDDSQSFTLDWTRNLASAWFSAQKGKNYHFYNAGLDVKKEPFAGVITENKISQTSGYTKDTGYRIENLRALMYVLALQEKNYFYIGAIRREDAVNSGKGFSNYVFDKTAVFFPYFNEEGRFNCIIFENGMEIPLRKFIDENKKNFVHLSRFLTSEKFFLQ